MEFNPGSSVCKYRYLAVSYGRIRRVLLAVADQQAYKRPYNHDFNQKPSGGKGKVLGQEPGILGLNSDSADSDPCAFGPLPSSGARLPQLKYKRFILFCLHQLFFWYVSLILNLTGTLDFWFCQRKLEMWPAPFSVKRSRHAAPNLCVYLMFVC